MEFHNIFGCRGKMLEVLFLVGNHGGTFAKIISKTECGRVMCSIICNMVKLSNPGNFIVAMADPRVPLTPVTMITCLVGDFSRWPLLASLGRGYHGKIWWKHGSTAAILDSAYQGVRQNLVQRNLMLYATCAIDCGMLRVYIYIFK